MYVKNNKKLTIAGRSSFQGTEYLAVDVISRFAESQY
jgi:hypothetical protein